MSQVNLSRTLAELARERPIFHSEADFQHALAWKLHEENPGASVRLEYKPFPEERFYVDIWLLQAGEPVAIELKYPTRGLTATVGNETFSLRDQAAQDVTRYDFMKDIVRMERVSAEVDGATAYVLLLTNDSAYWTQTLRASTVDAAFRLHEGRAVAGELKWAGEAGVGTMRGREGSLHVRGYYEIRLAHGDWWEPEKTQVPVGNGAARKPYAWVTTLPHSAAHATVFSFRKMRADLLPAVLGCFQRLGGVPDSMVVDNDSSIVADGVGRNARLHPEVSALCGHLGMRLIVLDPGKPESKGQVERTNGYLETSFLPLREFTDLEDLQSQHDAWTTDVAFRRHHRRVGGRVGDALAAERRYLHALPDPAPDVDRRTEVRVQRDGFVRVGDVDYSVPPGLARRRVQVRISPLEVVVHLEGEEIARHRRSFAPADVVLDPRHARALRLAREARSRLERGDVELDAPDLSRYDALISPEGADLTGPPVDPDFEDGSEGFPEPRSSAGVA